MNMLRLVCAQLLERIRRPGYLMSVTACMILAFLTIPDKDADFFITLSLGTHRGLYNSAWVGTVCALTVGTFLSLFGFYLAKGGIHQDARSGVGEIIAATQVSRGRYLVSRALSNLAYLIAVAAPMLLIALIMQWVRAEDRIIDLMALVTPFLMIALPLLVITSAVAVMFETVPVLRSGAGNIIYYFVWSIGLAVSIEVVGTHDVFGFNLIESDLKATVSALDPDYQGEFAFGGRFDMGPPEATFTWQGIRWQRDDLLARILWTASALIPLGLSIPVFNRFDPARTGRVSLRRRRKGVSSRSRRRLTDRILGLVLAVPNAVCAPFTFGRMLLAEIRITLGRVSGWWLLVGVGLFVACLATPLAVVREHLLVVCWLWPILIWSELGVRARTHRVDQLLDSSPHPVRRQLLASWLAGVVIVLILVAPALVRFAAAGHLGWLAAPVAATLLVPSLALFLGVQSGTGRLFEVIYLLWWYLGPLEKVPGVDYLDTTGTIVGQSVPAFSLVLAATLLGLAMWVRLRRLRG